MIKLFKRLFSTKKIVKREYTTWEEMHLRRLKQNETYSEHKGKKYYAYDISGFTNSEPRIEYVEILGYYSYYDVDGTVFGLIAESQENGSILNVTRHLLFTRKPHFWIKYLSTDKKNDYCRLQKYIDDNKLENQFLKELPVNVIREIKLKKLNI